MDKEVFIPKNSSVIEQAEILADMLARQKGFAKKSPQWEKAKQKFLEDRYYHSSIPHRDNPGTPKISPHLFYDYEKIWGIRGALAQHFGLDTVPYKKADRLLRGLITQITNLYLEIEYGIDSKKVEKLEGKIQDSNSPYKYSKKGMNSQNDKVYNTILIRQTFASLLTSLVEAAFSVKKDALNQIMLEARRQAEEATKSEKGLKNKEFFRKFWLQLKSLIRLRLNLKKSDAA